MSEIRISKALMILSVLWVFSACQTKNAEDYSVKPATPSIKISSEDNDVIKLGINLSESKTFLASEVKSARAVELETTDSCLIGAITNILLHNDTIIVVDGHKSRKIFLFDTRGNFLSSIGNVGEGPGEYETITNAELTDRGIAIHDIQSAKWIEYDFDGSVLETTRFDITCPTRVQKISNNKYLATYASYNDNYPYGLCWIKNDSIEDSAFPFTIKRDEVAALIIPRQQDFLYYAQYSDTVFSVKDKKIQPIYTLGLFDTSISSFLLKTAGMSPAEENQLLFSNNNNVPSNNIDIFVDSNRFIITHQKKLKTYITIVNTSTLSSRTYIMSDISKHELFVFSPIMSLKDGKLISYINEVFNNQVPQKSKDFLLSHLPKESKDKISSHDYQNANPIIIIMDID